MHRPPLSRSYLLILSLPLVFGLGLYSDFFGLKTVAFAAMLVAVYGVLFLSLKMSIAVVFVYIGFEGFLKVVSNYNPVIHVGADLMVIALCVKMLLSQWTGSQSIPITAPPFTKIVFVHFAWLGIVFLNPYALSFISSLAGSKIYISMLLLYFFGYNLIRSSKDIRFFMSLFLGIALVHSAFGLYQGIMGPESVLSIHPRYAVQLAKYQGLAFRPFGLTNQPGGLVAFLYPVVPFLIYFIYTSRSWILRILMMLSLPLLGNVLLLCQIRSGILKALIGGIGFLIGSIYITSKQSAKAARGLVVLATGICALLIYLLPQIMEYSVGVQAGNEQAIERSLTLFEYDKIKNARDGTFERFVLYAKTVPFGAGFARVGAAAGAFKVTYNADPYFPYKFFFADNFWLASLIEIGIPGMIILTLLLLAILYKGFRGYLAMQNPSLKRIQLAILCALISMVVGLYGSEGILYNPEACFFWFFSGVMMKIPKLEEKNPA